MADPEHVAKLLEGVEAWNAWRIANKSIIPDLSDAFIQEAISAVRISAGRISLVQSLAVRISEGRISEGLISVWRILERRISEKLI